MADVYLLNAVRRSLSAARKDRETFRLQRGALKRRIKRLEGFAEEADDTEDVEISTGLAVTTIVFISLSFILFGVPAAYLSWSSNSLVGWHWLLKLFFAFFSFLYGFSYLITYLFMKLDLVLFIKSKNLVASNSSFPRTSPPPPGPSSN